MHSRLTCHPFLLSSACHSTPPAVQLWLPRLLLRQVASRTCLYPSLFGQEAVVAIVVPQIEDKVAGVAQPPFSPVVPPPAQNGHLKPQKPFGPCQNWHFCYFRISGRDFLLLLANSLILSMVHPLDLLTAPVANPQPCTANHRKIAPTSQSEHPV